MTTLASAIATATHSAAWIDPATGYYPAPYSLLSLSDEVRGGMMAMGTLGLLSFLTTFSLFLFITYRMVYWERYYDAPISSHQFIILIYNLLLADLQQALSFIISFHWLHIGKITAPSRECFAQGWLIQIGDLSSGMWVLAIGLHTFYGLVSKSLIPKRNFFGMVILVWVFVLLLTLVGPATHPKTFFTNAGVWCWISEDYETHRLYLHYVWIFIAELGSVIIYAFVFIILQRRLSTLQVPQNFNSQPTDSTISAPDSVANMKLGRNAITTTTVVTNNVNLHDPFAATRQRVSRAAKYMVRRFQATLLLHRLTTYRSPILPFTFA
jgi:hypothetical protein